MEESKNTQPEHANEAEQRGVLWTDPETGETKRVSKTWATAMKYKAMGGAFIIYDPSILD